MDVAGLLSRIGDSTWHLLRDAAPWLLLGLLVSGLIHAWLPRRFLARWLGGRGVLPTLRAALIGTPVPLCSCSVLPAAIELRRGGASRGATISFLVATPENGADSIAVSWALLGPFLTIVRPLAALVSAVTAGLVVQLIPEPAAAPLAPAGEGSEPCATGACDLESGERGAANPAGEPFLRRLASGLRYAGFDLFNDMAPWMAAGLLAAGIIGGLVDQKTLASVGSGLPAMLVMLVVGVPMYICATASTPVAAAMLLAGMSPGTVLVFLLAGPATNLGSVGVLRREMGTATAAAYLAGTALTALAMGLVTDLVVGLLAVDPSAQATAMRHWVPPLIEFASLAALGLLTARAVYARVRKKVRTARSRDCGA